MTEMDRTGDSQVWLYRDNVRVDAEKLCGARFVPVASLPFEDHVVIYRIRHGWGEAVSCSKAESERWADAARTYLDTLSRALEELHRDHGGRRARVEVDLYRGERQWQHLLEPFPWPGWRRRVAARSEKAQRAFLARAELAAEEYRPVREEIERRIEEACAERRAANVARRREAERQRGVLQRVASRRLWVCVDRADASAVFVYRFDVSPSDPVPDLARSRSKPLAVRDLEAVLQESTREDGVQRQIQWDPRACAEVEKECREQGVDITFAAWWESVTQRRWTTRRTSSGTGPIHVSSLHSSYGVGFDSYDVGFDGGVGVSDSGGSGGHSGGYSFGGSF